MIFNQLRPQRTYPLFDFDTAAVRLWPVIILVRIVNNGNAEDDTKNDPVDNGTRHTEFPPMQAAERENDLPHDQGHENGIEITDEVFVKGQELDMGKYPKKE